MTSKFSFFLVTSIVVVGMFFGFSSDNSIQNSFTNGNSPQGVLLSDFGNVLVIMHDTSSASTKRTADRDTMYKYLPTAIGTYTVVFTDTNTVLPDLSSYKSIILQETSFDVSSVRYLGVTARDQIKTWLNSGTGVDKKILLNFGADQGYNYSRSGSNARDLVFSDNLLKFIYRVDNGNGSNPREIIGIGADSGNTRSMTSSPTGGGFWPDGCSMSAGGSALYRYPTHTDADTLAGIGVDGGAYVAASIFADPRYFTGEFGEVLAGAAAWAIANSACPFTEPITLEITDTNTVNTVSCGGTLVITDLSSHQFTVTATGNPDELLTLSEVHNLDPQDCKMFTFDPPLPITQPGEIQVSVTATRMTNELCVGFLTFTVSNNCNPPNETSCRVQIDNPLPVELASFVSEINQNDVTLRWATSSETNNSGFDIERSAVSGTWSKVGNVTGNGTSSAGHSYSFTDRNVASGMYTYRLKQIDFNGNFEYFNLSNEVNVGIPDKFELAQNYPNPFNPSTNISFSLPVDSKVSIKIFDMTGKEVATVLNENKTAGYYSVNFDATGLSSGVYFYNISADNFIATKRMMLLK